MTEIRRPGRPKQPFCPRCRKEGKEVLKAQGSPYCPEHRRLYNLAYKYGITVEEQIAHEKDVLRVQMAEESERLMQRYGPRPPLEFE